MEIKPNGQSEKASFRNVLSAAQLFYWILAFARMTTEVD